MAREEKTEEVITKQAGDENTDTS